jgi:hypothetical protein
MTYRVEFFNDEEQHQLTFGPFGNIESARQAMLDHANVTELPNEAPFHSPALRVAEGWFIERLEYHIIGQNQR